VDVGRETVFVGDNRGIMYALDARSGEARWRRVLDREDGKADIKTTPMVMADRGLVVVGAWSGKVIALREDNGETAWEHPTGGRIMGSTARLPRDGTIFVGSPAGDLFAIDDTTGATKWTFHVGTRIMSSPAVSGDGGAVVFGASDGNVYAVRTDSGEMLWSVHLGGRVSGSPTLVGDRIYVTSHGGGLWALVTHG
jgi:outer membrane protein assembly factor BamB